MSSSDSNWWGGAAAAGLFSPPISKPKEYEEAKDFRAIDLINSVPPPGGASMDEADRFAKKVMTDWKLGLYDFIPPEKYIPYASKHPCFIEWLLREGYIKEKVKDEPFEITLTIGNKETLEWLWHRLNFCSITTAEDVLNWEEKKKLSRMDLWSQVDGIKKEKEVNK